MKINDFIPGKSENEVLSGLKEYAERTPTYTSLTPTQQRLFSTVNERSAAIGRIHRLAPHLEPGVALALADLGASDSMIAKVGLAAINVEKAKAEKEQEENRQGNGNWLYGKLKTGLRWGLAAGQLAFDIPNTLGSSIVQPAGAEGKGNYWKLDLQNPFRKGWFASTEFGTMLKQDTEAGSGFMLGGKAAEDRERRVMEFAGKIPLTVEAGASENTNFEASPEQLHTVAMQILAQKDISYEEALDEANRLIRSNAFMSAKFSNVVPYADIEIDAFGRKFQLNPINFEDVGSTQYAIASVISSLALAVALPDPASIAYRGIKSGVAYAKGINYVDEAGNFLYDKNNIIARTTSEAKFMADTDALVVLANDFDVAALSATDEAIELATPQPGTWYHGSRTGPVPGDTFVDITDPRYPNSDGLLVGPGLYLSEAPVIGQTYARRPGATRPLTPEEDALYRNIPGVIGDSNLQLGVADPGTGVGGVPVPPAAMYRFIEKEGAAPRLWDADYGLGETLPGASAPQATAEEINAIAELLIDTSDDGQRLLGIFGQDPTMATFIENMNIPGMVQNAFNSLVDIISTSSYRNTNWISRGVGVQGSLVDEAWRKVALENPEAMRNINLVPPSITAKRVRDAVDDFVTEFKRAPENVEELQSFMSREMPLEEFLYSARQDSFEWFTQSNFFGIVEQFLYRVPDRFTRTTMSRGILEDRLRQIGQGGRILSPGNQDVLIEGFGFGAVESAGKIADATFSRAMGKFNSDVAESLARANLTPEEISYIERFIDNPVILQEIFAPGKPIARTELSIATFLKDNLGIDGWQHLGGLSAGWGAEGTHRVRVYFDPMKHLDIADALTGERLSINQAIDKMRESGELAERAGEIRLQIDELNTMREAGLLPGYGPVVDPAEFNTFFTQSRAGRFAAQQMWKVVEKFDGASATQDAAAWYELWSMFKGRIPLADMDEILKATSEQEMIGIINRKVGFTPGLTNMDDINFSLSRTMSKVKEITRIDRLLDKADEFFGPVLSRSPKSKTLDIFGSERDQLQALRDLDAFLETGVRGGINKATELDGVPAKTRETIVAKFAAAMLDGDRNKMFEASQILKSAIKERVLVETGDEAASNLSADIWTRAFDQASGVGLYQIGEDGMRIDNGYAAALDDAGVESLHGMIHGGPGLLSELLASPLELPDIQELRRMTSWLGIFTSKQGLQRFAKKSEFRTKALQKFGVDLTEKDLLKLGELRIPLRVFDFAMNKVWKNAKKFSLAYGLRNTMEAQARLAFSDKENIFTHPLDHILVASHAKIPDDILLGEEFNPLGWSKIGDAHVEAGEGYRAFLSSAYYGSDQAQDMWFSQFRNKEFVVFSKDNPADWAMAGGYELRQLFNDPIAKFFAEGSSLDDVMTWLYSDADDAKKALKDIENVMRHGEVFYGKGGISEIVPVDPTPANVRLRVETQQLERLNTKTGGDPKLMEVVSKGTIDGKSAFLPNGFPSEKLVEYLVENVESGLLPDFYKGRGAPANLLRARANWFEQATKMFFDGFIGRGHNILDRSPLWRREYAKEVARLAPLMSSEAAAEVKKTFLERVEHYNKIAKAKNFPRSFELQDYVGSGVDVEDLMNSLDNAKGWMSRDELHVLANGLTLDKIESLLFDASARNSLTDAARIVSPFGAAFAEVLKKWVSLTALNADKVNKANRMFAISTGEDKPTGMKNRGIIHKDPVSGQYFYSLPMSRQVASLFNRIVGEDTGAEYQLQAPVKGLNMAFNFTPGFGPVAGFPLGKLMYGSPQLRDYAAWFMPYGPPKSPTQPSEYLPGWASKIVNALQGDAKRAGVYGDTLSDVIRAEISTGKWDLNNPDERSQFYRDAEAKAKVLTMLRGFGQLVGPSAPTIEAKIKTEAGDIMAGHLTSEFHKLQSENYDTAVERYLAMFGEETFAYMAGKTRQVMSGVEASKEFAKWELENADLFDTPFAAIAGFFGPKGSDFDWAAYNYQTTTGKREFVPPVPTQVEMAEQIIGLHKYRQIVKAAGPNPNEKIRAVLAQQKSRLQQEYPGMLALSSYDVEKFGRTLKQLRLATEDPRLKNNETAQALKMYLDLREVYKVGTKNLGVGWESPKSAAIRADLRYRAQFIIEQTPEFGRLFERLLLSELEQ